MQTSVVTKQPARPRNPELKPSSFLSSRVVRAVGKLRQGLLNGPLDLAGVVEEEEPAILIPLGEHAAAEDEAELLAVGEGGGVGEVGVHCLGAGEGVVDAYFAGEDLVMVELVYATPDGPVFLSSAMTCNDL